VVTDTISDMLTRIRNANMIKHQIVQIPVTKMSLAICLILKEEGYIDNFEIYSEEYAKNKNQAQYILLSLKYKGKDRQPVITKLQRISKPGLRVYCDSKKSTKSFRKFRYCHYFNITRDYDKFKSKKTWYWW